MWVIQMYWNNSKASARSSRYAGMWILLAGLKIYRYGLWCGPETGWIGLDPTNDLIVADDHIVTAFGRDYADVAPLDGVVIGPGTQKVGVAVDVVPVG